MKKREKKRSKLIEEYCVYKLHVAEKNFELRGRGGNDLDDALESRQINMCGRKTTFHRFSRE